MAAGLLEEVIRVNKGADIYVTGHSLGGNLWNMPVGALHELPANKQYDSATENHYISLFFTL